MNHRIAYYITAHGFGHAVRSLEVIRELQRLEPTAAITIISKVPSFLITQNLAKPLPQDERALDVGMVQHDNLRLDLDATLRALQTLQCRQQELIDQELRFYQREAITAVVSDVAFLPLVAAAHHGIPNVGLGNFTWDWIYQHYAKLDPRWQEPVNWIRECYRHCQLFLQLPMHGDCSCCPRIMPMPLVTRLARRTRAETRELLGIGPGLRVFLLAFTALDMSIDALRRVEGIGDVVFLYRRPLHMLLANGYCVDKAEVSYPELVAAADAVITKPGYGIVADCLAQGTPMIYTDRGDFPEYDILVREMNRRLSVAYLPSDDLYAGRWEQAVLDSTAALQPVPGITTNGSRVCAEAIREHISGRSM